MKTFFLLVVIVFSQASFGDFDYTCKWRANMPMFPENDTGATTYDPVHIAEVDAESVAHAKQLVRAFCDEVGAVCSPALCKKNEGE